ncbi:MAG: hypothetical protein NC039_06750 [Muribaculaceae bacterium]|nr:hypothetical protein [Muribaculaceae bacterium]
MIDINVHVGTCGDLYYPPGFVSNLMESLEAEAYALSSLSMAHGLISLGIDEMRWASSHDFKALPILSIPDPVTPGQLGQLTSCGIRWRGVMLTLNRASSPLQHTLNAIRMSELYGVPLILRSDGTTINTPSILSLIESHPGVDFILSGPASYQEISAIILSHSNINLDTSHLPLDTLSHLVSQGLSHRLLWGSGLCASACCHDAEGMIDTVEESLDFLREQSSAHDFRLITRYNAIRLFKIEV